MRLIFRPNHAPELRIGDAVTLNSGGPVMTVYDIDQVGCVMCCWLDGHLMCRHTFPPICLTKVVRA